ncbi:hypothetical protein [Chitinophaga filiformis]|uniref:PH domain-containing protein n=1 Tax=Chitinophaga filiformis TaxID=104663 RepID=A0ABY4I952_CHIFI|nr:hypothetical protein [Chitinophaga filiformis]UPK72619.1 hypothetical protein MYF79_15100 [Chitinophaga filiformis]
MKVLKRDFRVVVWFLLFSFVASNSGFIKIHTNNWVVNLINILMFFGIFFQMSYFVSILIGKKQYFTVIQIIPSHKERSGFILGGVFNLKRKYFYVIDEEKRKFVVSSFFSSKDRVFQPNEKIRGYKGFGFRVKMIDRRSIVMRAVVLVVLVILLYGIRSISQWLKLI